MLETKVKSNGIKVDKERRSECGQQRHEWRKHQRQQLLHRTADDVEDEEANVFSFGTSPIRKNTADVEIDLLIECLKFEGPGSPKYRRSSAESAAIVCKAEKLDAVQHLLHLSRSSSDVDQIKATDSLWHLMMLAMCSMYEESSIKIFITLCKNAEAAAPLHLIPLIIPGLRSLIKDSNKMLVKQGLAALCALREAPTQKAFIINHGFLPLLVSMLCSDDDEIALSAMHILDSVCFDSVTYLQRLFDQNLIDVYLPMLLIHKEPQIQAMALNWITRFVVVDNDQMVTSVMAIIVEMVDSEQLPYRFESAWAVNAIINVAPTPLLEFLVAQGLLSVICKLLTTDSTTIKYSVLLALGVLLEKMAPIIDLIISLIIEINGHQTLTNLLGDVAFDIRLLAHLIVDQYFSQPISRYEVQNYFYLPFPDYDAVD